MTTPETAAASPTILAGQVVHDLKIWPEFYTQITSGQRRHEVRSSADRSFRVGEFLRLREWDPATKDYTGRGCLVRISAITAPGTWGLPADLCVMSII